METSFPVLSSTAKRMALDSCVSLLTGWGVTALEDGMQICSFGQLLKLLPLTLYRGPVHGQAPIGGMNLHSKP